MSNTGKCKFPVIEISLRLPSFLSPSMFPPVPYPLYSVALHIFMNSCLWWKLMRIEGKKTNIKCILTRICLVSVPESCTSFSPRGRARTVDPHSVFLFLFSPTPSILCALSLSPFLHPLPWPSLAFFPLCQSQLQTEDLSFLNNSQVD